MRGKAILMKVSTILTLVLVMAGVLLPSIAFAYWAPPAYEYLDKDAAAQRAGVNGLENYTLWDWKDWWGDHVLNYYISGDAWYEYCIQQAISHWTDAIPEMQWQRTYDQNAANMQFTMGVFQGGPSVVIWLDENAWYGDTNQNANFWVKAEVRTDFTNYYWPTASVLIGVLAHEIGHLYGLHDRYLTWVPDGSPNPPWGASCNPKEVSIMDTCQEPVWNEGQQKWQVPGVRDGLTGPAQQDINNVYAYWGQGAVTEWDLDVYNSPSVLSVSFDDQGWAETHAILMYYYWNGSQWVYYEGLCYNPYMGVHHDYPGGLGDFLITRTNVPAFFGASGHWNYCKVGLYFRGLDCGGGWVNSPSIWIP